MADITALTRAKPVKVIEQVTAPIGNVNVVVGMMAGWDSAGKLVLALADGAAGAHEPLAGLVVSVDGNAAGATATAVKKGYVDCGDVFTSLAYGAGVWLSGATAGRLADAAATQIIKIGQVEPVHNNVTQADKLLRIDV